MHHITTYGPHLPIFHCIKVMHNSMYTNPRPTLQLFCLSLLKCYNDKDKDEFYDDFASKF